jgi:hypothetical protein
VNAGANYTIPAQTYFKLTGAASDPNGDALTYNWEEFDLGTASPPNTDNGSRPIFRSFNATTSPSRYFPRLSDILNNVVPPTFGESLPTTTRTMNFRLTARDNRAGGGGVDYDTMSVSVIGTAGPFQVTAPNTAVTWQGFSSQTVTWNVANTSAAPVSCANVNILLSTDGGNTFPTVLAANTPNDGSQSIVVPNTATSNARIQVACATSIFFDVGNANFTIQSVTPTQRRRFDFDGDDKSDLLWRNVQTGSDVIWRINGTAYSGAISLPGASTSWQIVGEGDFNADNNADILWRNASSGNNAIWYITGSGLSRSATLPRVADTNWKVAGTADFNADGKTDILWRHASTGNNTIWLLDGATLLASGSLPRVGSLSWKIAGTGDFNGDGMTDILWRNTSNGSNTIWYVNGVNFSSTKGLPQVADQNWKIAGAGDVDGNGTTDIVWRHDTTGNNVVWRLNSAAVPSSAPLQRVSDVNWKIVRASDFNGDGKADIVWRHAGAGTNSIWLLDGTTLIGSGSLPQVADQNWRMIGTAETGTTAESERDSSRQPAPMQRGSALEPDSTTQPAAPTGQGPSATPQTGAPGAAPETSAPSAAPETSEPSAMP